MLSLLHNHSNRQRKIGKWILLGAVVAFWLYFGMQEFFFNQVMAACFQKLFTGLGFPDFIYGPAEPINSELTKNGSRLITLSFGLLYCGFSLLIIQVYFLNLRITRIALGLYLCLFLISILINETGKGWPFEPFRVIAYRIMTLIISPMPIILLIPALHLTKVAKNSDEVSF